MVNWNLNQYIERNRFSTIYTEFVWIAVVSEVYKNVLTLKGEHEVGYGTFKLKGRPYSFYVEYWFRSFRFGSGQLESILVGWGSTGDLGTHSYLITTTKFGDLKPHETMYRIKIQLSIDYVM